VVGDDERDARRQRARGGEPGHGMFDLHGWILAGQKWTDVIACSDWLLK
jgi:hypothetical protein